MTNEESKAKTFDILRFIADNAGLSTFEAIEKAYNMGVSEQQPCEDCISREELRKLICQNNDRYGYSDRFHEFTEQCLQLPSVTPKYTDEEIQKMQELEQAQLEKAYELGMQTSFEEWLSSFNTDSAPQCFNAVQQLKEKMKDA